MIMSDHGFSTYQGQFYINKWLESRGYLKVKISSKERVYQHKFVEEYAKIESRSKIRIKIPMIFLKIANVFRIDHFYNIIQKYLPINLNNSSSEP